MYPAPRSRKRLLPAVIALVVAFPAHARLVAADDAKIYRYVERSTCYTIITNMEPSDEEVAAHIPKGRFKANGYCGPTTRPTELPNGPLRIAGRPHQGYMMKLPPPSPLPRRKRVLH